MHPSMRDVSCFFFSSIQVQVIDIFSPLEFGSRGNILLHPQNLIRFGNYGVGKGIFCSSNILEADKRLPLLSLSS